MGCSGAVAGCASSLDTSTGKGCEALSSRNDTATAADVRQGSTCSSASSSSSQRCSGGELEGLWRFLQDPSEDPPEDPSKVPMRLEGSPGILRSSRNAKVPCEGSRVPRNPRLGVGPLHSLLPRPSENARVTLNVVQTEFNGEQPRAYIVLDNRAYLAAQVPHRPPLAVAHPLVATVVNAALTKNLFSPGLPLNVAERLLHGAVIPEAFVAWRVSPRLLFEVTRLAQFFRALLRHRSGDGQLERPGRRGGAL